MKKWMKKLLVVLTAMSLCVAGPISALAASFEDGESTGLALTLFIQNGADAVESWKWQDCNDPEMQVLFNTPAHYVINVAPGSFSVAENPLSKVGFKMYFGSLPRGGSLAMAVSIVNLTLNAEGFDPIVIPAFTNDDCETQSKIGGDKDLMPYMPTDIDLAAFFQNLKTVEFDANVVGFDVLDADGNLVYHPGVVEEETEEGETVEGETPEETEAPTEAPTTAAPTTEAPTEAPTTAAPATEAATEEETETVEETKAEETKAEEKDDKDDKDDKKSMIRIIITIAATVLLVGALVFVALLYRKNR